MVSLRLLSAYALLVACAQTQAMQTGTKFIVKEGYNQESPIDSFISLRDKRGTIVTINQISSLFAPRYELLDAFGKPQTLLQSLKAFVGDTENFLSGSCQIDPLEASGMASELLMNGHSLKDQLLAESVSGSILRQEAYLKFNQIVIPILDSLLVRLERVIDDQDVMFTTI